MEINVIMVTAEIQRSSENSFTWMLSINFVGGPGHIEVLRSAPEGVVEVEVSNLSVKLIGADVALDEVVGGPLDGRPAVLELTCG
jgi:hypothetical protein